MNWNTHAKKLLGTENKDREKKYNTEWLGDMEDGGKRSRLCVKGEKAPFKEKDLRVFKI